MAATRLDLSGLQCPLPALKTPNTPPPPRPRLAAPLLGLSGLRYPLPALRTRKPLQRLAGGDPLTVLRPAPLAAIDLPNLVRETGDVIEEQTTVGSTLVFRLVKASR